MTGHKAENNDRLIIGIGHKARQGKDTAAEYLRDKYHCSIIHFANALYEECRNGQILYKSNPDRFWLKPLDEPYFHFSSPPEVIVDWILKHGEKKNDLPFEAEISFGGMKNKDGTLLQFWGTEFRRKCFDWDYWVEKVRKHVEAHPGVDFLIPDVRFKNEAAMIKDLGGTLWKIDRSGFTADDRDPNHPSEIDLDDWVFDELIINKGSIPELCEKAGNLYRKLKGK